MSTQSMHNRYKFLEWFKLSFLKSTLTKQFLTQKLNQCAAAWISKAGTW